jgi:hypothetical protein
MMQANLARWNESLEAFGAMIEAREIAAGQREPHRQQALEGTDLEALAARHRDLAEQLAGVEARRDIVALAADAERRQWSALERIDRRVAALPAGVQRDEYAERARRLRGALLWDMDAAYRQRLSQSRRDLRRAAAELEEATARYAAIAAAGDLVPQSTVDFAGRVEALSARVARMTPLIDATALAQERALAELAVAQLQAQQKRLGSYATQAQFALASLYDGASSGGGR